MRRNQLLLCLVFSLCLNEGCAINPISGEEDFMLYPEQHDIAIGRKYAPEAEKQLKGKIPDEELQNYIDTVGQRIARISHRPDWEYHFIAVQDESINALALPGGYVFITKGLLAKLTTEAQLASILAHEVAHAVARDSAAAISREIGIGVLFAAAVIQDVPQSALEAANITRQILGLQYSRDDERAADLAGLDYMVRAGYNPQGMIETMQILQDEQKVKLVEFFSTHPNPQNRINYLTQKIHAKYLNLVDAKIGKEDYHRNVLAHLKESQTH